MLLFRAASATRTRTAYGQLVGTSCALPILLPFRHTFAQDRLDKSLPLTSD